MKKYKELLILLIMQIFVYKFIGDREIFIMTKYFTLNWVIYIMISILFNYVYLTYFIEQYYTYLLNRNHVITRCGRKGYYKLVLGKITSTMGIFFLFNIIIDKLIINKVVLGPLLINTIYFFILMVVLPKRKDYSSELVFSLLLTLIIKWLPCLWL